MNVEIGGSVANTSSVAKSQGNHKTSVMTQSDDASQGHQYNENVEVDNNENMMQDKFLKYSETKNLTYE